MLGRDVSAPCQMPDRFSFPIESRSRARCTNGYQDGGRRNEIGIVGGVGRGKLNRGG